MRARPDEEAQRRFRHSAAVILALCWCAGFVDVVGYVTLGNVFLANMSGNAVKGAITIAHRDWAGTWPHVLPIGAFVLGLLASGTLHPWAKRRGFSFLRLSMSLEAALVTGFAVALSRSGGEQQSGSLRVSLMVLVLGFALGLQNATLRRAGSVNLFTTHITGSLSKAVEAFTEALLEWLDQRRNAPAGAKPRLSALFREPPLRHGALLFGVVLAFVLGAVAGAALLWRFGPAVLLGPVAVMLGVGAWDTARPIEMQVILRHGAHRPAQQTSGG